MNNRHLPAGPAMQGVGGPGSGVGGDMPPTGPVQGGGGNRRRGPPQHYGHQQFHPQTMNPYAGYMPPYGQYYHPQMHSPYQNGSMPSPGYMPYPAQYAARSPPMQPYVPMVGVTVQQSYSPRQSQNSPALSTPYQPPAAPPAPPLATPQQPPSLAQSPRNPTPLTSPPPPPPQPVEEPDKPTVAPAAAETQVEAPPVVARPPFKAPLPWLSMPDAPFPKRQGRRSRRRQKTALTNEAKAEPLVEQRQGSEEVTGEEEKEPKPSTGDDTTTEQRHEEPAAVSRSETASTRDQRSASVSTSPTSPTSVSVQQATAPAPTASMAPPATTKPVSRPAVPALPIMPAVPRPSSKDAKAPASAKPTADSSTSPKATAEVTESKPQSETTEAPVSESAEAPAPAPRREPAWQKPKSWASLLTTSGPGALKAAPASPAAHGASGGDPSSNAAQSAHNGVGSYPKTSADSLAAALHSYRVGSNQRISLIEPRGLTNGGNMCYMNSVLQVLLHCTPFYDFLDQVSRNAVHNFKSETPLIDAMILFTKEFRVIASAGSVDQLREKVRGKDKPFGEPLTPNFLYDEMKRSKWFATLEQGHQQDAEEFLGWLLQALDDECSKVMGASGLGTSAAKDADSSVPASPSDKGDSSDAWMEVGRRQKPAITRSVGSTSSSPISKIFGGLLRSELRVPGKKPSITTEPYQPLQLDIGSPAIRNIIDALKGLTSQEKLHGDFNAARGKNVEASKQVLIDELPPVLILHLKRFQYDAEGGITKISKKIGYPLELDIPREVLSRQKVVSLGNTVPRYRLFAVVYHHGKNAGVGHYTVDVRRQDGSQWIRFDDTKIEPVRAEDVAGRGAEEENVKDGRRDGGNGGNSANRFGAMNSEDNGDEEGWKQVQSSTNGSKRWSSVVNGGNAKAHAKSKSAHHESINERTVAYLLFYQRI